MLPVGAAEPTVPVTVAVNVKVAPRAPPPLPAKVIVVGTFAIVTGLDVTADKPR